MTIVYASLALTAFYGIIAGFGLFVAWIITKRPGE